ncbi:MAG: response regulator [Gammaproteobacteria bacterium]|nr:response regulator [Gammaproteobacteria bacterium]
MNSFIGKRVYLSAATALLLLFALSCLSAFWQYNRIAPFFIDRYFSKESEALTKHAVKLQQVRSVVSHIGKQSRAHFSQSSSSHSSSIKQAFINSRTKEFSNSTNQPSALINVHSDFINSAITGVTQQPNIRSAFFLHQLDQQSFNVAYINEQLPELQVFQWVLLREKYLSQNSEVTLPTEPFYLYGDNNELSEVKNYLIYRVEHGENLGFWLFEIELELLFSDIMQASEHDIKIWESHSGVLVSPSQSSEKQVSSRRQTNSIADVLPSALQTVSYYQPVNESYYEDNALTAEGFVLKKAVIANGWYSAMIYQSSQVWLLGAISESLKSGFVVFVVGCFALFVFIRLVVWSLALPTSRLLTNIESSDGDISEEHYFAPDGWHAWFGRVQRLSQENKRLLKHLSDRSQGLDNETRMKHRELLQQSVSKDRHLALNEALMNAIPDLLYYKNVSGGYLGCNKAYEKYIGEPESELVTKLASDIYPPKRASEIDKIERDIIAKNQSYVEEGWSKNSSGELVLLRWLYSPITSSAGEVLGILGLAKDITEQQQSMNELSAAVDRAERADQIKGEFIANISHEIRTPMNSIIGMLQLLDDISNEPNQKSYIKIADSSAKSLLAVINNILDFSKASASKMELEIQSFSLTEVLDSAFANVLPRALKKGLILDCAKPIDIPEYFESDAIKLTQILTNLLGNAVKFTESGSVKVAIEQLKSQDSGVAIIQFKVIDTGIGIEDEKQSGVFEAFSQADSSVTRKYGGTGLGLTIVYQLVQVLKGTVDMRSTLGVGTEITVKLPLKVSATQPVVAKSDHNWLYWDSDPAIEEIFLQKLSSVSNDIQKISLTEQPIEGKKPNSVLLCRSESLHKLPASVIDKVKKEQILLQPVAFEIVDHNAVLLDIPHLPILNAPFHATDILDNLANVNQVRSSVVNPKGDALSHLSLLVVEDNLVNQQVIKLMLMSEQAQVAVVNNGEEALHYLAEKQVDIVITDIQMPVMDGLTLAAELRKSHSAKQLPIIAVSAHTNEDDAIKSKSVGIDCHLAKPVDKTELISALLSLSVSSQNIDLTGLSGVLDIDFLMKQFSNDESAVKKILTRFLESQRDEIQEVIKQLEDKRFESVTTKIHALKGTLGGIGAKSAYQSTVEIEQAIKNGKANLEECAGTWRKAIEELINELSKLE